MADSDFKSKPLIDVMITEIPSHGTLINKVNSIFELVFLHDNVEFKRFTFDYKRKGGAIYEGSVKEGKSLVTIYVEDADFVDLCEGRMETAQAFMEGKMRVEGDVSLLLKIQEIFEFFQGEFQTKKPHLMSKL